MTVAYTPVSQRSSSRRNTQSRDLESNTPDKPFRMSVGQRQPVGMVIFVWFGCLWIGLKMMEAAQYSHRSPLLPTTNALLDTADLYHSLTVPLLEMVNRTKLISTRCGATTLEPHLLSFLTNNLAGSSASGQQISTAATTATSSTSDTTLNDTNTATTEQEQQQQSTAVKRTRPYRYLFALVLQDSEMILPDILTRVLETISILGPDNCHLSIVDHASLDNTKTMLDKLKEFLDMYNRGDIQLFGQQEASSEEEEAKEEQVSASGQGKRKQYLPYTITTMTTRDTSVENVARIKDLALDPLLAAASTSAATVVNGGSSGGGNDIAFDRVILLDPVVTCAEDILELVFQSLLQDTDVTCGMDLGYHSTTNAVDAADSDLSEPVAEAGKPQEGVYDSTVTRDMLHQKLHRDAIHKSNQVSNDPDTQTRALWTTITTTITTTMTPSSEPSATTVAQTERGMVRMVVVPSIQFTDSPKEYVMQGLFNGWGLWPKTEKQYRDELENRLIAISHRPLYGYRPSTSSYGYTPRVEEENDGGASSPSKLLRLVLNGGSQPDEQNEPEEESQEEIEKKMKARKEDERMISEIVPEETVEGLKTRLETIGAVFGVQDIQNAVLAKRDEDLITSWRLRFVIADALDGSVDC
ncbi:capsular associated protein [Linnemannia exigua]|uniref:Capsular associated protein n=1 Tax=Linnemannia exigua TaxID=604196 RepID=A0AAD4H720_9FUNG|nr:capsular associated protein [Linnemannia exigua]